MKNRPISVTAKLGTQGVVPINTGVEVVEVETSAGATSGITLPVGDLGQVIRVINNTGSNIRVWPAVGGYIGGGAINTPVTIKPQPGRHISFIAYKPNKWSQSDVQWR
jgi:hypothetical protein